uniref:Uncharacterized protein n=1 Tax=Panagrolaimus sp. JU765 TaxID=591449 RepID=A0AC34RCJ1_9BILA
MIVMDGRLVLFLAILPVLVESFVDLRAIKFAERSGDCFVDVYQPVAQKPEQSEPLTNFFIRQSFKSLCYPGHVVRNFNLLPNGKGGYRFTGCFYFQEKQTLKCERFEENKFVQNFDVACNSPSVFKDNRVAIFIKHDKFEVYNNKDVCALESWKNYVPHFYPESLGFWQYNAVLNKYDHLPSKAFEEYFSFGKVEIQKHDFSKFERKSDYMDEMDNEL